jgi:hypothetical protein
MHNSGQEIILADFYVAVTDSFDIYWLIALVFVILLLNIAISFYKSIYIKGIVVKDRGLIAKNYLKTLFITDTISLLGMALF